MIKACTPTRWVQVYPCFIKPVLCYFTLTSTILLFVVITQDYQQLKADWPHWRDYPHASTNYRHTDNHPRLVMTLIALWCTRQIRASNIDRCTPEIWPWPLTFTRGLHLDHWPWPRPWSKVTVMSKHVFLAFDLDLWPTTLTYYPSLF